MSNGDGTTSHGTVLWWLPAYPPDIGGVETFAATVVPELHRRGHAIELLIGSGGPSDERVDGVVHMRYPLRRAVQSEDPAEIIRARRWVHERRRERSADLHHVHFADASAILHLTSAAVDSAPSVVTLHNEPSDWLADPAQPGSFVDRLFASSSVITGVSASVIRRFADEVPQYAHRMVAVPNGIRIGPPPPPVPTAARLVALGRMTEQKGFDRLVNALPAVVAEIPGLRVDIVGDGECTLSLKQSVRDLGLVDNVNFWPAVPLDEVSAWIESARVVVTPSRFEGLCLVALEAAERGRPVVATDVSGLDDVVEHGRTGYHVDNNRIDDDPGLLAAPLVELLRADGPAAEFGAAARERARDRYGLDRCVAGYEFVYRSVLNDPVDLAVVVPAFDAERHLAECLESILADVGSAGIDAAIIVVDDGSRDRTPEVAARYTDSGVMVFRQPNLGGALARNAGLALTSSRWVSTFDADDIWPHGRTEALLAPFTDRPDLEAVFGRSTEFDDGAPPGTAISVEVHEARMVTAAVVRRSVFDRIGGFRSRRWDTFEWTARALGADLNYVSVDTLVLRRRIHDRNASHGLAHADLRERLTILRSVRDLRTNRTDDSSDGAVR